jgi:hypothetical protein
MLIQIKIIFSFMDHITNMRKGYLGIAYFQANIQEHSTDFERYNYKNNSKCKVLIH